MVEQKELTQVTCEDAAGQTTEFMLGRVLPGQRNGSQLWHECFSNLLKSELGFAECEAYPCLLRTGGCECLLMLHVDDVLCLSHKDYLECVLLPALKAKYKISSEKVENPGDELTFLKRRHVLLSENELAVQSHPKHLERLFDLVPINRNLKPKKTPGHPMLSANIQFEVCLNVWPNQLSEPLHVCGICVCICLDALTTASCFRTRPTMGYCTTMSWTTPWRCIQTAIGLSTKPQGEVFHQDVCFCLATFFTPLPGVRKLWH